MDKTEPELSESTLSRDGSFFSLTSGNSMYVTAAESLSSEDQGSWKVTKKHGTPSSIGTGGGSPVNSNSIPHEGGRDRQESPASDSSSATFGEGESLEPDETWGNGHSSSELEVNGNDDERDISNHDTPFAVKEDVSRICNEIAESIPPDTRKKAQICLAISGKSLNNLEELRKLAISEGGLLNNALRQISWPALLGILDSDIHNFENSKTPKTFQNVTPEIQNLVCLDVARVLKRFPPGLDDPQQAHLQAHLTKLICSVLNRNPEAYYYQGFHDISLTFLLVCISQSAPFLAYLCLNKMVETSLAPFMEKTMDKTHELIYVVFSIIEREDKSLFNKIVKESSCPAIFSLPWVITWFSHTLPSDNDVFRLYDFILGCLGQVSHPYLIPIFISAALVLRNSSVIKNIRENDMATMHQALSGLPANEESLEEWLKYTLKLMRTYRGKEAGFMTRARELKQLQNEDWSGDSSRPNHENLGMLAYVGRFIFVKHKWYTIAAVVVGLAYLIQSKYGYNFQIEAGQLKLCAEKYVPNCVKSVFKALMGEFEFE